MFGPPRSRASILTTVAMFPFAPLDVSNPINVAEKTLRYRLCTGWFVIAGRLTSREPTWRGETVLAVRPEHKVPGISQQSVRKFRIGHNARQHHTPHQG